MHRSQKKAAEWALVQFRRSLFLFSPLRPSKCYVFQVGSRNLGKQIFAKKLHCPIPFPSWGNFTQPIVHILLQAPFPSAPFAMVAEAEDKNKMWVCLPSDTLAFVVAEFLFPRDKPPNFMSRKTTTIKTVGRLSGEFSSPFSFLNYYCPACGFALQKATA